MKKTVISIINIGMLSSICQIIFGLPWWVVFIIPLVYCYVYEKKELNALFIGFTAIFLYWSLASFLADINNDSILSTKVGALFMGVGTLGLIIITGFVGGIAGALGAWCGSLLSKILNKTV